MPSFNSLPDEVKLKIFTHHFENVHIIAFCPCIKDHTLRGRSWMNMLLLSRSLKPIAEEAFLKTAAFIQAYDEPGCWCDAVPTRQFRHIDGAQSLFNQFNKTLDQSSLMFANLRSARFNFTLKLPSSRLSSVHSKEHLGQHVTLVLSDLQKMRIFCATKRIDITADVELQKDVKETPFMCFGGPYQQYNSITTRTRKELVFKITTSKCAEVLSADTTVQGFQDLKTLIDLILLCDLCLPDRAAVTEERRAMNSVEEYYRDGTLSGRRLSFEMRNGRGTHWMGY